MIERRQLVLQRGLLVALALAASAYGLWALRAVLTPLLLAFAMAYLLNPVVTRLERWRVPRAAGVLLTVLGFLILVTAFFLLVIPAVVRELVTAAQALPAQLQALLQRLEPWLERAGVRLPHDTGEVIQWLRGHAGASSALLLPAGGVLGSIAGSAFGALGAAVGALVVPILAIYLLSDFDRLLAGAGQLIPPRYRAHTTAVFREIDAILMQFLRGQLTVMGILAVLYAGAYSALRVPLAVPIGLVAGLVNFIPYVGGAFALVAGLGMALLSGGGWEQLLGVLIAYSIIQTLEGFVITPRIVGQSVGIAEVWVLIALYVGGELFGFLGVLLALPGAAVLKILIQRALSSYTQSELFLAGAPLDTPLIVPPLSVPPEPSPAEPGPGAVPSEPPTPPPDLQLPTSPPAPAGPGAPPDENAPLAPQSAASVDPSSTPEALP